MKWPASLRKVARLTTALWTAAKADGPLTLKAQLTLTDMLRPAVQPGSKIDHELPAEQVTFGYVASASRVDVTAANSGRVRQEGNASRTEGSIGFDPKREQTQPIEFVVKDNTRSDTLLFGVSYSTNEDKRPRSFPLHRALLPWADTKADIGKPVAITRPPELDGGSSGARP